MEGVAGLLFLCVTMFLGSFLSGMVPLALSLSESKMRHITILGAGLLIGTALAVIIPEGILALYSSGGAGGHSAENGLKADDHHLHKRDIITLDSLRPNLNENDGASGSVLNEAIANRFKRQAADLINKKSNVDLIVQQQQQSLVNEIKKDAAAAGHEHDTHGEGEGALKNAHSAIGITLVLGFVFMLIIDQIGGGLSHRSSGSSLDPQSIRSKKTFITTLGLVVHSAADGIALGAAAATSKTDVEMIVFAAIMIHKAPASFGLVSFLIHEGLDRIRVRKHLAIFALAAPLMAIFTFLLLQSHDKLSMVNSADSTGLCMLFSAGTFLYVSTVHVLPEVQAHNEDRQFRLSEMFSFIIGALLPIFLSMGHSH